MQSISVPAAMSSKAKRRIDFNATGYPSVVNYDVLSKEEKEHTTTLPECRGSRKSRMQFMLSQAPQQQEYKEEQQHEQKGQEEEKNNSEMENSNYTQSNMYNSAPTMLTTAQLAAKLTEMSAEMRKSHIAEKQQQSNTSKAHDSINKSESSCNNEKKKVSVGPHHGVEYDERTTYRLDYSRNAIAVVNNVRNGSYVYDHHDSNNVMHTDDQHKTHPSAVKTLKNYRDDWTSEECQDIDQVMKLPYLTLPSKLVNGMSTVYRRDLLSNAARDEYRLLSHKVNLNTLPSSYAYSKYGVDDPRREITFNPDISHLSSPHSLLVPQKFYNSYSCSVKNEVHHGDDDTRNNSNKNNNSNNTCTTLSSTYTRQSILPRKQKDELERLRALRRTWAGRSTKRTASRTMNSCDNNNTAYDSSNDYFASCSGNSDVNWNEVFGTKLKADYIYLPRDTFMANKTYDCEVFLVNKH